MDWASGAASRWELSGTTSDEIRARDLPVEIRPQLHTDRSGRKVEGEAVGSHDLCAEVGVMAAWHTRPRGEETADGQCDRQC